MLLTHNIGKEPASAEKHFVLGNEKSARAYGETMYYWFTSDSSISPDTFAGRPVLNYLLAENLISAWNSLETFTKHFTKSNAPDVENMSFDGKDFPVFKEYPQMNFLHLLIFTAYRKDKETYLSLVQKYPKKQDWEAALAKIEEIYFGIRPVSNQPNILANLMSSLFSGPPAATNQLDLE